MWKTKLIVTAIILNLAFQPLSIGISQANDEKTQQDPNGGRDPNSGKTSDTKGYVTLDTDALMKGEKDGKKMSWDEQLDAVVDLGNRVGQGCLEYKEQPVTVKGEGHSLKLVDANGNTISDEEVNKNVNPSPTANTTELGIIAYERPQNCFEALALFAQAKANFEDRYERALAEQEKEKQDKIKLAEETKRKNSAGCPDGNCGKEEIQKNRAPGSSQLANVEAVLNDVKSEKTNISSTSVPLSKEQKEQMACAASPDQWANTKAALKKVGSCSANWLESLALGKPPEGVASTQTWLGNVMARLAKDATNCVSEIVLATLKATWSMLKAMFYDLPKAVYSWATTSKAEDKSSDASHDASKLSDQKVAEYKKSPYDFIVNGLKNVANFFLGEVTQEMGCEKWSGAPFFSDCQKPWTSWQCASCEQTRAMACSAYGAFRGSITGNYALGHIFRGGYKGAKGLFTRLRPSAAQVEKMTVQTSKVKDGMRAFAKTNPNATLTERLAKFKTLKSQAKVAIVKSTPKATGNLAKVGNRLAQLKNNVVFTKLGQLGRWSATQLSRAGKGVNRFVQGAENNINWLDRNVLPSRLVIRPLKSAHSFAKDYWYAQNRAFEGRLISTWNMRTARLADKSARRALAATLASGATMSQVTSHIDELAAVQQKLHLQSAIDNGSSSLEKMADQISSGVDKGRVIAGSPVVNTTGIEAVDALGDFRKVVALEQKRLEAALAKAKASGKSSEIKKVEGEIRQFIDDVKEGYLTNASQYSVLKDSDNLLRYQDELRRQGFALEVDNAMTGAFRIKPIKENLDSFYDDLLKQGSEEGFLGVKVGETSRTSAGQLMTNVKYQSKLGIINVEKPTAKALEKMGYQSVDEYYDVVKRAADENGLFATEIRSGERVTGITIRPKQGSIQAYEKAEKQLAAQLDEGGYNFDKKTGKMTPKEGADQIYGGTNGYQGVNRIIARVEQNNPEIIATVRKNADEAGYPMSQSADNALEVNLEKMKKACEGK